MPINSDNNYDLWLRRFLLPETKRIASLAVVLGLVAYAFLPVASAFYESLGRETRQVVSTAKSISFVGANIELQKQEGYKAAFQSRLLLGVFCSVLTCFLLLIEFHSIKGIIIAVPTALSTWSFLAYSHGTPSTEIIGGVFHLLFLGIPIPLYFGSLYQLSRNEIVRTAIEEASNHEFVNYLSESELEGDIISRSEREAELRDRNHS